MGCCLSQPEIESQENVSRTVNDTVASPAVPPPQYIERHDYVVESGKPIEPILGESSSDRVQEQHRDEKKKQPSGNSNNTYPDLTHSISAASGQHSAAAAPVEANSTIRQQEKKETDVPHTTITNDTDDTSGDWPIIIRSSMAGKDITMHLPGLADIPYWTLHELRQHLEPQLQKIALASSASSSSSSSTSDLHLRVRFIYLGKILSETTTLIPLSLHNNNNNSSSSSSSSTAPSDSIILDKYGVIQAMVSKMV